MNKERITVSKKGTSVRMMSPYRHPSLPLVYTVFFVGTARWISGMATQIRGILLPNRKLYCSWVRRGWRTMTSRARWEQGRAWR
jgi:hypothetical protein